MDAWMGWNGIRSDEWMDGEMDRQMNEYMNGLMDG